MLYPTPKAQFSRLAARVHALGWNDHSSEDFQSAHFIANLETGIQLDEWLKICHSRVGHRADPLTGEKRLCWAVSTVKNDEGEIIDALQNAAQPEHEVLEPTDRQENALSAAGKMDAREIAKEHKITLRQARNRVNGAIQKIAEDLKKPRLFEADFDYLDLVHAKAKRGAGRKKKGYQGSLFDFAVEQGSLFDGGEE